MQALGEVPESVEDSQLLGVYGLQVIDVDFEYHPWSKVRLDTCGLSEVGGEVWELERGLMTPLSVAVIFIDILLGHCPRLEVDLCPWE